MGEQQWVEIFAENERRLVTWVVIPFFCLWTLCGPLRTHPRTLHSLAAPGPSELGQLRRRDRRISNLVAKDLDESLTDPSR